MRDRLVHLWESLRREAGIFSAVGLRRKVDASGLDLEVEEEPCYSGLAVSLWAPGRERGYLLPDFSKPAVAMQPWFTLHGSPTRTASVDQLLAPALLGKSGNVELKGAIQ